MENFLPWQTFFYFFFSRAFVPPIPRRKKFYIFHAPLLEAQCSPCFICMEFMRKYLWSNMKMKGNCFQQTQHTINICLECRRVIHFVYETLNFVCSFSYILIVIAQHNSIQLTWYAILGAQWMWEWSAKRKAWCIVYFVYIFSCFSHI